MSNLSSSGSNDSVLEPLLQQHDDDDDDENKTPLTSSRKNEDANDTWLVSSTNHCTSTSKNKPNLKTDSASVKSRYTNKNLLRHCKKPSSIGQSISSIFTRRKRAFVLLGGTFLFLFYINSMIINRNSNQMIPVTHHSTVPGMKALNIFAQNASPEQQQSTLGPTVVVDVTKTPDKITSTRRSRSTGAAAVGGNLIPLKSTAMPRLDRNTKPKIVATTASSATPISNSTFSNNSTILPPPPSGYLVWSDKCKMPSIDPYTAEVMQYFKREKYEPCSTSKPLTKVAFNSTTGKYNLLIIQDQVKYYTKSGGQLDCCYQVIERKTGGEKADQEVGLSECLSFRNSAQIPNTADNILVKCKSKKKQTYINGHPMMPERAEIRKRLQDWKKSNSETKKPVSVLMIGIDSISRVNLIRAMPKTAQYLYDNEWFEMSGYNKMGDNTFPNLMAILTGYNQTVAFDKCAPTKLGALDRCPFIWKSFREHGYVTAYAEDESSINTFNYLKLGFEKPPVDYYLRPFLISAEHNLVNKLKSGLIFCLGYQHSADYIYDYALELATRYRDDPFFGLFWANTFSHNDISDCSSMDDKMQDYLKQLAKRGILDRSIVIFFSDHGMRFGPTRKFLSGHLEERLPFMFIWLPPGLKNSHTEFVNALSVNKNRLTNPYDLHMTLKHILELSGRVNNSEPSQGCPKCQTLLKPVPHSRSCDDAAIEDHWCTCIPYTSIYKGSNVVTKIAKYSINYINDYVADFKNGSVADRCALLSLSEVQSAYRALHGVDASTNVTTETYRIIFITKPNYGLFEATVRYTIETENMEVTGSISRLNSYASDSSCVSDGGAKKYCSCALNIFAQNASPEQQQSTLGPTVVVDVTKTPDKITSTRRSRSTGAAAVGGNLIPLKSTAMPRLDRNTKPKIVATTASSATPISNSTFSNNSTILPPPPSGYLVWSDKCKMPSIDPYTAEVMQYFKREKYEPCSTSKPLTKVAFNSTTGKYNLLIIQDQVKYYTKSGGQLDCCYQVIERKTGGEKADQEVGLSECLSFRNSAQIPNTADNILVKCKSKKKQTYINGHPMMPERAEIRKRLQDWKKSNSETKKPVSVLMIGIDSISRVNLIRAMPKTAQYLYDNEWFEMSGYNKMGDNTFPNLMAILTGYNQTVAFDKCAPTKLGALDRCPFIWKSFREHGYVTAYAEDESSINTFNYLKLGFEKPPVDYYLRPFLISAEHNLVNKLKSGLIFCLGYQHSADYIYDYALELATRYRDDPFFGLFWANTFSHNDISDCSSMDDKMQDYLKQLAKRGILDRSIVIFFSDHGMRFGPTRKFLSGHLEERLPFMFIWLPPGLKNSHTEFVNALSVNKNRLTNPYDLHMTLKHILELSGRVNNSEPSQGCPKCQTLLKPVPHSRSCDDAAIEDHWCTCIPYTSIYKGSNVVTKIAKYSINYINDYVADFKNGSVADRCALLSLSEVQSAYRALHGVDASTNVTTETYRIIFITKPNYGLFEATVRYTIETENMEVTGSISRLNSYASDSSCVSDGGAKKYCSCGKSSKNRHTAARAPAG